MILFPAIDLKDGACVRLLRGAMEQATVFNADPAAQAKAFAEAGAHWLHVVDLNGAFAGRPVNEAAVRGILAEVSIPVQLGGGIRDRATIEAWLTAGISRVILGTVALRDPALVRAACRDFPGKVAVGIDARGGKVAVEGWAETSEVTAIDLAKRFEDAGVAAIIHTDIERDGAMGGPNLDATAALADPIDTPVIVSGGVSTIDDLRAIRSRERPVNKPGGILGAIVGRALYDGGIELAAALEIMGDR